MLMSTHSSGSDTHTVAAAAAHTQQQHLDRCSVAALFRSSHCFRSMLSGDTPTGAQQRHCR
ncbi:hypothetical protein ACSBR1_024942 [Camellia fascicularis]